jgi:hypothetical protein
MMKTEDNHIEKKKTKLDENGNFKLPKMSFSRHCTDRYLQVPVRANAMRKQNGPTGRTYSHTVPVLKIIVKLKI